MAQFRYVKDVLARDLSHPIEEVIKLSQTDESVVYTELTEYVITDNLRRYYTELFKAINESVTNPTEGIGVWVSGFFGSGKSSFVKNLGYVLANLSVKGRPAADIFIEQVREFAPDDTILPNLIRNLTARVPFEVIMFDVSADRAVQRENERLAEVMYRVLLRQLDYEHRRYDIAELEIELEAEDRLAEFVSTVADLVREKGRVPPSRPAQLPVTLEGNVSEEDYALWRQVRSGAQALLRASAALNRMDPATYPKADSWAEAVRSRPVDISVNLLIERTFDLAARRRPGKAVFFIIDEVGQYVARSGDKILDLQGVAREFGRAGRNRVVRGEAPAPVWLIVTSQEKLNEVVDAIGDRRIDLAKLQDSFHYHIDLGPQDIQEVAAKRVLVKRPEAVPTLEVLFREHRGALRNYCKLEQTARFQPIEIKDFVETYPYLPHHIGLSIDIMSALRLQTGDLRHLGGSNRTIIKQAYEMLVNDRTRLADKPLGTLVTFDKLYELVEHNLSSEKQRDIADIDRHFTANSWESKVARVLALIEQVEHLPRTEHNIAALLYEHLGDTLRQEEVAQALRELEKGQFVRHTESGWKLLTTAEKTWETERKEHALHPSQEIEILREALRRLWDDPALRTVAYSNLRNFSLAVQFEGRSVIPRGDISLHLFIADSQKHLSAQTNQSRQDTRASDHHNEVHWVFPRTSALDNALVELYRSTVMVNKYGQIAAQGRLSPEQSSNLENEKRALQRWQSEVDRRLREALSQGQGVFRGTVRPAADFHGKEWRDTLRGLVQWVVPQLYEKLEMGSIRLPAKAAETMIKAASLDRLPPVFYEGEGALGMVVKTDGRYVISQDAPPAAEILAYIRQEQDYGNSVTGKRLEEHFSGPPYGWQGEVVHAVLAALVRGGQMEIVQQGRRHSRPDDPVVRRAFSGVREFRSTTFRLRQQVDIRKIVRAVETLRDLTGHEVDAEEMAVYEAAQNWARETFNEVRLQRERARAHRLSALDESLAKMETMVEGIRQGESDVVVLTLADQGKDLRDAVAAYHSVKRALTDNALAVVHLARRAFDEMWPDLSGYVPPDDLAERVEKARDDLISPDLPDRLQEIESVAREVAERYREVYADLHTRRGDAYQHAIERVMALPEWEQVDVAAREDAIRRLTKRACASLDLPEEELVCKHCRARIPTMASDLRAVDGYVEEVRQALVELAPSNGEGKPQVVYLRLRDLITNYSLRTPEDVEALLSDLRKAILKHIRAGEEVEIE